MLKILRINIKLLRWKSNPNWLPDFVEYLKISGSDDHILCTSEKMMLVIKQQSYAKPHKVQMH